jgi:hypothetical protein
VESLPAYRDLVEFAPRTLGALGHTGLISLHSAAVLRATLLSAQCISCREYGAFLFLPTCERCCYECLCSNQSFRVLPVALAGRCFSLTQSQLKKAPIMRSIPGVYSIGHRISRYRRLRLISAKHARELGIMVHGSVENMANLLPDICEESYTFEWLLDAPLEPLQRDPSTMPSDVYTPDDYYCGMASTHFPSLFPNNALESGLWCRGCEWTFESYKLRDLTSSEESDLIPQGVEPFWLLSRMQYRARSRAEFPSHVKDCYGARKLVPELGLIVENE